MKKLLLLIILSISALISHAQTDNIKLYTKLADTAFEQKDYVKAFENYKHLVMFDQKNSRAFRRMGFSLLNCVGEDDQAIVYFKKAIEIDPNDKASLYYLGTTYAKRAKEAESQRAQNKAIAGTYLKKALALGSEDAKSAIKDLNGI